MPDIMTSYPHPRRFLAARYMAGGIVVGQKHPSTQQQIRATSSNAHDRISGTLYAGQQAKRLHQIDVALT